ncbi:MAG: aminotransferase class V-fold PLP-dependent enzyme [Acidobacteria bacterium]|nr:aminotransferase class V-fold PLP-dependent enzyme [Acidobacteriota bacterium]
MNRKTFLRTAAGLAGGMVGLPLQSWLTAAAPGTTDLASLLGQAGADGDQAFWRVIRTQFVLDPDWTFLNFGGLGACPLPVLNSLAEAMRTEELAPSAGHDAKQWDLVKERLARLLGREIRKEDLALVSTATEAINLVVSGLPLRSGDEVITSTHEHAALYTALLNRRQRDGIVIRTFEPDRVNGQANVDRIAALVTPRTRLIFISHVTCTTGQLFPVKAIAALAQAKKVWFALDGAQAPVCVPFDLGECGADFYACSTHKWIMGPKRTGFLYVRPGLVDVLRPLALGMGSFEKFNVETGELVLHPGVRRFEWGTQNEALFFALGRAVEFVQTIGVERIWRYDRALAERFYRGLRELPNVETVSPDEEAWRTPMIGFRMRNHTFREVGDHLTKDHIRVRTVTEGGLNSIRVSFFICNHDGEVTAILDSLKKLA